MLKTFLFNLYRGIEYLHTEIRESEILNVNIQKFCSNILIRMM